MRKRVAERSRSEGPKEKVRERERRLLQLMHYRGLETKELDS